MYDDKKTAMQIAFRNGSIEHGNKYVICFKIFLMYSVLKIYCGLSCRMESEFICANKTQIYEMLRKKRSKQPNIEPNVFICLFFFADEYVCAYFIKHNEIFIGQQQH